jgi:mono/diheme cytochrome c family protein
VRVDVKVRRPGRLLLILVVASVGACEKHEFEPPDRDAQIVAAADAYSAATFDTIAWPTDSIRALDGNVVFSTYCRNCHGTLGKGATEYALGRDLEVPSLVAEGWRFDAAPDSVRHKIFVGHAEGMPTWGVAGLTPREIDAVTYYILDVLRPEVLGG